VAGEVVGIKMNKPHLKDHQLRYGPFTVIAMEEGILNKRRGITGEPPHLQSHQWSHQQTLPYKCGLFLFFLLDSRRFVILVLPEAGVRTGGNRILLSEKTRLTG
jgi:hypothetical protein